MQLLAGVSYSVFENVDDELHQLYPMKWLPAIRRFLHHNNATLELEENFVPQLQRTNDAFLMDFAVTPRFTPIEIERINAYVPLLKTDLVLCSVTLYMDKRAVDFFFLSTTACVTEVTRLISVIQVCTLAIPTPSTLHHHQIGACVIYQFHFLVSLSNVERAYI